MDVNELMIGDWVMVNDVDHPNPIQVDGIYKKSGAYYAVLSSDLSVDVDKIEPIRLTTEILERNGFPDVNYGNMITSTLIWYDGLIIANCNDYREDFVICECKYVHQFQHLLKLCGMSEITP